MDFIAASARHLLPNNLEQAHRHSSRHREELRRSGRCGCFYCLAVFQYQDINEWTDDGQTACCPVCNIDSVLGDASGFYLSEDFLRAMHDRWFEGIPIRQRTERPQP
jgi:hypothetical protein